MSSNENNLSDNQPNSFGLPGGYFQKSAASLMNKIEWEDEHKAYPFLIAFKGKNGFIVPEGYFETCETQLELTDCPALKALQKQTPFVTPNGYFDLAEETELSKVIGPSENEVGTFERLNAMHKQNAFAVSENYFEDSENRLQLLLKESKTARVVNLFFSRTAMVAAALVTVVTGLWIYSVYMKPVQNTLDCGTIACVDKIDVIQSKSMDNMDDDDLYELVNPADLEKKLNEKKEKINQNKTTDSSLKQLSTDALLDEI